MYEFYSEASKIFKITITQDSVAVDIRGDQVKMILHSKTGSDSQAIDADVTTSGETGIAILQCDFTVPAGMYDVEIDYIVATKIYVQQRMEWKCIQRIEV
jgi:hypothetical protein